MESKWLCSELCCSFERVVYLSAFVPDMLCFSRGSSIATRRHSTATRRHSTAIKSYSIARDAISKCFAPPSKPDYWGNLCDIEVPLPTDIPSIQANFQIVDRKVEHLAEWSFQNENDIWSLKSDEGDLQLDIIALEKVSKTLKSDVKSVKSDLQSLRADLQSLRMDNL